MDPKAFIKLQAKVNRVNEIASELSSLTSNSDITLQAFWDTTWCRLVPELVLDLIDAIPPELLSAARQRRG